MPHWKRTLLILAFVQLVSAVGLSSFISFLPLYVEDLGSQAGLSLELLAGLVFSAQALTMMIAAPIWGALADRRGRKMMVMRATLGGSAVVLLMGFARSAEELVALRALQGLITGVLSANTALVTANVPRERTGYALGILQVGLWAGISAGPLLGGALADTLGFQAAFVAPAGLLLVAGTLVWLGVEEHFEPLPAGAGLGGFVGGWRRILAVPGVRLTYLADFLNQLGRTMVSPFMPLFVQLLMGTATRAATASGLVLGGAALAGTVAAIYLGRLGDQIGHRRVLIGTALAAALLYLPQSAVTAVWQLAALQLVTGAAAGGTTPSLSALLARHTQPGEEGAVYGLESSIVSAARGIAPLAGAALVSAFGLRSVYTAAGLVFGLMLVVAARWLPEAEQVPIARAAAD